MIVITIPETLAIERGYGYRLLFATCLELPVEIVKIPGIDRTEVRIGERMVSIYCEPASRKGLISHVPEVVQVRETVLDCLDGVRERLPVIFMRPAERDGEVPEIGFGTQELFFDIGLAAFFIASGTWELAAGQEDRHGRITGTSSWLDHAKMREKPIVEIYAKLLARLLFEDKQVGSYASRNSLRMCVTCDVDRPFDAALYEPGRIARRLLRNLAIERSFRAFGKTIRHVAGIQADGWSADPNNTFEYMMAVNERRGFPIGFYFICHRDNAIDANYDISSSSMLALMRRMSDRGHRLGVHGSYCSQYQPGRLRKEVDLFRDAAMRAGCFLSDVEGRQHYLRWNTARGVGVVEDAGIGTDLTLGFHDCAGFRRGLCRPFPLFDVDAWRLSSVIERPLIAMDCAVIESEYLTIKDPSRYLNIFAEAANWCKAVNGEFVLLWHNSFLKTRGHCELYESVLSVR